MRATEFITTEAFDAPYPMTWEHNDGESHDALVRLPDGSPLSIMFSVDYGWSGDELWTVEFWRNNSQDVTGEGDAQRIFATVLSAIQQFIDFEKPEHIQFSASKETDAGDKNASRSSLYTNLVKRYARSWGYDVDVSDRAGSVGYDLHRMYKGVNEDIEIPQEIYNLLDELTADDTGSEDFGNYVLRFEGFTDWCQQDAAERCDLPDNDPRKLKYYDDVYDEVLQGWIQEQGSQPVDKGFAGDEDYPVQWAVFKKQGVAEGYDTEELANEVYAEFERIYPNLARRANERTVHAAIVDVLNYGGDNDPGALAQDVARAVKQQMQQGVAEGSLEEVSQDTARSYAQKARASQKDLINQTHRKGADTDKLNKKIQNRQQGLNRAHTDKRYYKDDQGVAEGMDAESYKQKLLSSLPQMMRFYEKNVKGWKPSEEQMLAAVETGYTVMKHTGDVKQAGKAVMDELNTLHRMSQGQQGVAEELEEGWKDTLGNLAIAGAIGLGGTAGMTGKQAVSDYFSSPNNSAISQAVKQVDAKKPTATFNRTIPAKQQATQKAEPKKVEQPKPVKKKIDVKPITGNKLETILLQTAKASGLKGAELAAFMAQCAHETLDFQLMIEHGGSLDFRKYDPKYAPKKAKSLGNKHVGDGAKYKGRGFIQLTGRYNYKKAGEELGLPLEQKPQLVEDPKIAARVAVWFWQHRVQPNVDNFHDVLDVTKYINPAMRGLKDRKENFKEYMSAAEQGQMDKDV